MPLLDHFNPPLSKQRHWESFHAMWAAMIVRALNRDLLPAGYYAEVQSHVGGRVEVDVAALEEERGANGPADAAGAAGGGTATAQRPARLWTPPAPDLEMPAIFPDSIEALVFHEEGGPILAAAIELISPGNKDRPATRRAFAAKCAAYLQQGVGLITIDVVTAPPANLHNELVRLMEADERFLIPPDTLRAAAYRPVRRPDVEMIQVWTEMLSIGQPLPVLPLALHRGVIIPLDLDATYSLSRAELRLA